MLMPKVSLRDNIIDAGLTVMLRKGYVGAGVRDIVNTASAPLGSFTNHFRSKEIFAQEVLDRYFVHVTDLVNQTLNDKTLSPRERLMSYLNLITKQLAQDDFTRGCLIGDFSLEAAPQSELLRKRLLAIFNEWKKPFASCIKEAQALGEIDSTFSPDDLADFLLSSWEGAILRMKVEQNAKALERFKKIAFQTVLKNKKNYE